MYTYSMIVGLKARYSTSLPWLRRTPATSENLVHQRDAPPAPNWLALQDADKGITTSKNGRLLTSRASWDQT